jgi:hypothetical protein
MLKGCRQKRRLVKYTKSKEWNGNLDFRHVLEYVANMLLLHERKPDCLAWHNMLEVPALVTRVVLLKED